MKPFRFHHFKTILEESAFITYPIDAFLRNYFKENHSIGSKDRKEIAETLYALIRNKALVEYLVPNKTELEERLYVLKQIQTNSLPHDEDIPEHIKVSFPKCLFSLMIDAYGKEKAKTIACNLNKQAPFTIRVNTLKISREKLYNRWKDLYPIRLGEKSDTAIIFETRVNLFGLEEFKEGLFEVQDEGSQVLSSFVDAKPKQHVLDMCAGSGGKTLAFAPRMQEKGVIYLNDIREYALVEAKKRLKRAGVQNAQIISYKLLKKKTYLEKMDWILLDVPCSGTGTYRRNPDMKWKFSEQMLHNLVEEQRAIFKNSLKHLRPNGHIVYATCSILPEENLKQIKYFEENFPVKLTKPPFQSLPEDGQMDGFFAAVLTRVDS